MSKSNDRMYTMQEMANILDVNKTTVYRYLKKETIAPDATKSNTNYYDEMVMQRLKKHFNSEKSNSEDKATPTDQLIDSLRQQVKHLQQQLDLEKSRSDKALLAKDKQIDELNSRLRESHQLQLGLQKKLKMLPEPNGSNVVYKAEAEEVKEDKPQKSKRSFWKEFFGK